MFPTRFAGKNGFHQRETQYKTFQHIRHKSTANHLNAGNKLISWLRMSRCLDLKDIGTEQSADYRQFVTSVQPLPELTNTERETPPRQ